MAMETSASADMVDGVFDRKNRRVLQLSGDSNRGIDSAYNSEEEGSHIDQNMGKKKSRKLKSKEKKTVNSLIQSIHLLGKGDSSSNAVEYDVNGIRSRYSSGDSSHSSESEESHIIEAEIETITKAMSLNNPDIYEELVKIEAENCRTGDCLLQINSDTVVELSQKTKHKVYSVMFGGYYDNKNTTQKWMTIKDGVEFWMLDPSSSDELTPEEPAPIEENSPVEEEEEPAPPNEEDESGEGEMRPDQVDAYVEETDQFTYRFVRVNVGGSWTVVAVHVDDVDIIGDNQKPVFYKNWKVDKYQNGSFFTLWFPTDSDSSNDDMHLAVTYSKPKEPFFTKENENFDYFNNPMVRFSIWPSNDPSHADEDC